ncbi:SMP-30/gluconolactonase/LRE family protein [Aurantiacibacter sp. MUD11]|uniref:SMP-30/gluconolactonase/LRE family protein n=1 Tax=Aurantiacibacter sp. MUD11 TaxID=3003265 RepID=UPI0022AAF16F|nr:SMP-30/gluconolactonase/LRE family protein [Aurantiacibacter sp. MUD11]WAT18822.1 SMP-30/gluconolactonase/LRE family protein [Aurantiacibacter sp. MUD11]
MMRHAALAVSLIALATSPALAEHHEEQDRAESFAELPYWPGYWVSELQAGTLIGGHNPALIEARETGQPIPDFMRLNGASAPWTEEGRQRRIDVRAGARGRKSTGWGFPMMMNAATPLQIIITPEQVTIINAYNEARYIYTDGRPMPDELDMWPTTYGTSVGHWEGDTLVVETRMVTTPSDFFHGAPPFSEEAVYHERITLEGDRLVSRMVIEDPVTLSEPWEVEVAFVRDEGFDRMIQFDWDNDRTGFDGNFNTIEMPGADGTAMLLPAIDGVVDASAAWEIAWSGPMTADGMSVTPEGHLLFAQEQSNAIWRLTPDGQAFVEYPYVLGAGAVSVAHDGSVLAIERGCTDPGLNSLTCDQPSTLVQLGEERRIIADAFDDGSSLGRLNDVHADGRGGAWVTQGALHHIAADGSVSTVYTPEAFTNGVTTSPDGSTLYVTDMRTIVAFDLDAQGNASNQRVFATLSQDTQGFGGDGLAVDAEGRLYVTGDAGIYVFAPDGTELGVIPIPRRAITLAFAGTDRSTLYVGAMGARTPEGEDWTTPEGVRNVAMTVYKLPVLTAGPR